MVHNWCTFCMFNIEKQLCYHSWHKIASFVSLFTAKSSPHKEAHIVYSVALSASKYCTISSLFTGPIRSNFLLIQVKLCNHICMG
ncbi:hypothetical protein FKM82_015263 [Ascaphus truei]